MAGVLEIFPAPIPIPIPIWFWFKGCDIGFAMLIMFFSIKVAVKSFGLFEFTFDADCPLDGVKVSGFCALNCFSISMRLSSASFCWRLKPPEGAGVIETDGAATESEARLGGIALGVAVGVEAPRIAFRDTDDVEVSAKLISGKS